MAELPVLLLAAGASIRMGQPKQLLPWGDKTLIEHQVRLLVQTGNPVFAVLGSNYEMIIPLIEKLKVKIIINNDWESGMGSSVACGVSSLLRDLPYPSGVLITLLDQPLILAEHFRRMISEFIPGNQQIIASASQSGWIGVPALFDRHYFEDLITLNGDRGARKIIDNNLSKVTTIICEESLEDMDTPESYRKILEKYINLTRTGHSD